MAEPDKVVATLPEGIDLDNYSEGAQRVAAFAITAFTGAIDNMAHFMSRDAVIHLSRFNGFRWVEERVDTDDLAINTLHLQEIIGIVAAKCFDEGRQSALSGLVSGADPAELSDRM